MATRGVRITGELMATGEAKVQCVQTTCDGGIAAIHACWQSRLLKFSLALIFVASELDYKKITWPIKGMDVCVYRRTSLLSA